MIHKPEDWVWHGMVGHCVIGDWCRFHLHTEVGPWRVSTIGCYVHPSHSGSEQKDRQWWSDNWPGADVGLDRKFETMVFPLGHQLCECGCGARQPTSFVELTGRGTNDIAEARKNHMEVCLEFANKNREDVEEQQWI